MLAGLIIYVFKFYRTKEIKIRGALSKRITLKIIKLYIPLLGQDFIEGTLFTLILTGIVSRIGIYEIATYNLAESIGSIMILPVYAFSTSAITLSIQKSFSSKKENPNSIMNAGIILSCLIVLSLGIFTSIFSNGVFGLITNDEILILRVNKIFIFVIVVQVLNIFNQIYKSYLQGINSERFVLLFTVGISITSILWITILSINWGLAGVYIGLAINNLILSIVYYLRIRNIRLTM